MIKFREFIIKNHDLVKELKEKGFVVGKNDFIGQMESVLYVLVYNTICFPYSTIKLYAMNKLEVPGCGESLMGVTLLQHEIEEFVSNRPEFIIIPYIGIMHYVFLRKEYMKLSN